MIYSINVYKNIIDNRDEIEIGVWIRDWCWVW